MAENIDIDVNSGVQTNIGMEFQKNCTVYLFLEKYEELKNLDYFIILEHVEDIIFGFLNGTNKLTKIETFQAKKSTNKWTLNGLLEIINKITATCQRILDDDHQKSKSFYQENNFVTNNTIELKCQIKGTKNYATNIINEANTTLSYLNLDQSIREKISTGGNKVIFDKKDISNLETIFFKYIDLSRTPKSQLEQLRGKFQTVFGNKIIDYDAALKTFLHSLKEIESTFNQGNYARLSDKSKRIESSKINEIINILISKKLAYDFWRKKGEEICEALNVSIFDSETFKMHYENSFDEFKDLNASEHRKIFNFIRDNKRIFKDYLTDKKCILAFFNEFNKKKSSTLEDLQLKAAISAAYLETRNTL